MADNKEIQQSNTVPDLFPLPKVRLNSVELLAWVVLLPVQSVVSEAAALVPASALLTLLAASSRSNEHISLLIYYLRITAEAT